MLHRPCTRKILCLSNVILYYLHFGTTFSALCVLVCEIIPDTTHTYIPSQPHTSKSPFFFACKTAAPRLRRYASVWINPRPAGGVIGTAPKVFLSSQKNGGAQRRRFCIYLTGHSLRTLCVSFDPRSCQVRSPGHAKWPHLQKTLRLCPAHSFHPFNLRLTGVYKGDLEYNLYISKFSYRWPKVRSILGPAHAKSMGKFSKSSKFIIFHQNSPNVSE